MCHVPCAGWVRKKLASSYVTDVHKYFTFRQGWRLPCSSLPSPNGFYVWDKQTKRRGRLYDFTTGKSPPQGFVEFARWCPSVTLHGLLWMHFRHSWYYHAGKNSFPMGLGLGKDFVIVGCQQGLTAVYFQPPCPPMNFASTLKDPFQICFVLQTHLWLFLSFFWERSIPPRYCFQKRS